ncbi:MAG TPA: DUF951 domain-containing protein [Terriglobales bacterium]|nr:DUF951 domain-containing protein [Terriglobales bacterium]
MEIQVGDICIMKKPHPCGGDRFVVRRVGMDIRIECLTCGREIWMLRSAFEKGLRRIESEQAGRDKGELSQ